MRRSQVLFVLIIVSVNLFGQTLPLADVEYGSIDEIRDAKRIYVMARDLQVRRNIVRELLKYRRLSVAGTLDEADVVLYYDMVLGGSEPRVLSGPSVRGELVAVAAGGTEAEPRARIVWSTRKERSYYGGIPLARRPEINAAREFLRALKLARGEKL